MEDKKPITEEEINKALELHRYGYHPHDCWVSKTKVSSIYVGCSL
jgi:hypothetical protein